MTGITQKQLIEQIKTLKEIKPKKEWATLLKSTLLSNRVPSRMTGQIPVRGVSFSDIFSAIFAPRKLAYSFAVILFLIVGVFGFATQTVPGDLLFPIRKIAEQSQAALSGQTMLRQDVAGFSNRINDLAQVAKDGRVDNIPSAIIEISNNASKLVKELKTDSPKDSETIKEIAASLKTLASVGGTDLSENQDVKNLYQAVVQNQIADLHKTTLTDEQKNVLVEIEDLYSQEKYTDALEKILLINI